jgi:hypothetical protein
MANFNNFNKIRNDLASAYYNKFGKTPNQLTKLVITDINDDESIDYFAENLLFWYENNPSNHVKSTSEINDYDTNKSSYCQTEFGTTLKLLNRFNTGIKNKIMHVYFYNIKLSELNKKFNLDNKRVKQSLKRADKLLSFIQSNISLPHVMNKVSNMPEKEFYPKTIYEYFSNQTKYRNIYLEKQNSNEYGKYMSFLELMYNEFPDNYGFEYNKIQTKSII